eukprot:343081-Pelagomonas_calceolata.AAC.7
MAGRMAHTCRILIVWLLLAVLLDGGFASSASSWSRYSYVTLPFPSWWVSMKVPALTVGSFIHARWLLPSESASNIAFIKVFHGQCQARNGQMAPIIMIIAKQLCMRKTKEIGIGPSWQQNFGLAMYTQENVERTKA